MSDKEKGIFIIRYVNGKEEKYEFTRQENSLNMGSLLKEALNANQVILEKEDSFLIIPFQSIQAIEVSPKPAKLSPITVRNVRLMA